MMLHFNFQNKEIPAKNSVVPEGLVLLVGKTCLMTSFPLLYRCISWKTMVFNW